ncbi:ArdC family protein [Bacillus taeanensis]|uniref:Antirestriction protein n=1 Tax=Bacillus taeanensis TaxID=273032 RepID=A0A366XRC4_9BACI|nr:zincin-like metallopeptidase domain-containing protein [Bacillus taeanensis]RBW68256.1 antirestriction protein [Bacillus taeanensis]
MASVYEIVTNKIIEKLEEGMIPWRRPWTNAGAVNWKTQKPYRGINVMLLESGEYASFKQIQEAGGKVKKGEKAHIVVFWKWLEKEDEETGKIEKIPMLRYFKVFNIQTQVEGLKSKRKTETFQHNPVEEAEKIIKGYQDAPRYTFMSGEAYYLPSRDIINVPPMKDFPNVNEYYSTMFHEIVHSTGHERRLHRQGIIEPAGFGSETYSREELIAEMGAAMLCGVSGIDNSTIDNSASYINSWLRKLKEDSRLVVQAAAKAQHAADYILGVTFEK